MNKNKLKKLKQLEKVCALYDCRIKCLQAVTYLIENETITQEEINFLFDNSKTCSNTSIREFLCEVLPEIGNGCVYSNLEEKIKTLSVLVIQK